MEDSYLDTLRNLQHDPYFASTVQQNIHFHSYEEYLHKSHRRSIKTHSPQVSSSTPVHILTQKQESPQSIYLHIKKVKSNISYIPVQRKVIEFQDQVIHERVPKKTKIVCYEEKKEIEIVPKEVVKVDYYAVEHIRRYMKEVVPEKIIEKKQVPKVIKKIEYIPVERQIIHYPVTSHEKSSEQMQQEAQYLIEQQGVTIKQNVEFKPLGMSLMHPNNRDFHAKKQEEEIQSILKNRRMQVNEVTETESIRHERQQIPMKKLQDSFHKANPTYHVLGGKTTSEPYYNSSNYSPLNHSESERSSHFRKRDDGTKFEYSFAHRERYDRNLASRIDSKHRIRTKLY